MQTVIGLLDWKLSMQDAIALPRILNMNGATELEAGTPLANEADALRDLGHQVQVRSHEGGLTGVRRVGDGWEGGADPRRDGVAKGE
jgi:gamma-glutamyltranspeptidase/glutathione hydrolase